MTTGDPRATHPPVLCPRCRVPLPVWPGGEGGKETTACGSCGAPVGIDGISVDVIPDRGPPRPWGARAMQSQWLSRIYETWWRPLAFGLSTAFSAPGSRQESHLVLARLSGSSGPWLDLSCGPGTLTRALVARAQGRAVVGVDLSRAMLERAHAAAPEALLVRADAAALPFADGTFGAVANLAALDLYADPARVIAESVRVLAPSGRWICSTFVASDGPGGASRRALRAGVWSASRKPRKPTVSELVTAAEHAGLKGFGSVQFHRYIVAWADKR